MYLTAPLALGGLKIDRPLAGRFLGLTALSGLRVVETAVAAVYSRLTAEKPNNRASPVEMHPFCLRHLPRRGRFALCLTFISYVMNRISEISRLQRLFPLWCLRHHLFFPPPLCGGTITRREAIISLVSQGIVSLELPPPGEVPPQAGIGVHFQRPQGGLHVLPSPARAVVWFYTNWRRSRLPPPSEPCEPIEPSEPSGKLRFPVL